MPEHIRTVIRCSPAISVTLRYILRRISTGRTTAVDAPWRTGIRRRCSNPERRRSRSEESPKARLSELIIAGRRKRVSATTCLTPALAKAWIRLVRESTLSVTPGSIGRIAPSIAIPAEMSSCAWTRRMAGVGQHGSNTRSTCGFVVIKPSCARTIGACAGKTSQRSRNSERFRRIALDNWGWRCTIVIVDQGQDTLFWGGDLRRALRGERA